LTHKGLPRVHHDRKIGIYGYFGILGYIIEYSNTLMAVFCNVHRIATSNATLDAFLKLFVVMKNSYRFMIVNNKAMAISIAPLI
jgi:hypothetical protein